MDLNLLYHKSNLLYHKIYFFFFITRSSKKSHSDFMISKIGFVSYFNFLCMNENHLNGGGDKSKPKIKKKTYVL